MMAVKLKRLEDQVIVITGASSGIGLATAKMAGERGARVVLAARDSEGLNAARVEIEGAGGRAVTVVADVSSLEDVRTIARTATEAFGGFDTWVNNAGLSIYGPIEEVPVADARRLFDVNYWGVVHGSLTAIGSLKDHGGALINLGSTVSDRAIPLQGHYSASKHAVKAFTDTLRMEVEKEGAPVSVTLIKPGAIDTPFPEHARNYMEAEPKHPAPVYDPSVVAEAILFCAEHPRRDLIVGGGGKMTSAMDNAPRVGDRYMRATMFDQQKMNKPSRRHREDSLYEPQGGGRERGNYPGTVRKRSLYTTTAMHRVATVLSAAAVGAGVIYASRKNWR
jgi:NAD(P)-dependent dehydrogenase (short-subunit alcohol dehydrogenase family)